MRKIFLVIAALLMFGFTLHASEPQRQITKVPLKNIPVRKLAPDQTQPYAAMDINGDKVVKDNVNKLMWEVKSAKDNHSDYTNPNDADNKYAWYDPNPNTNGTVEGQARNSSDFLNAMNNRYYAGYNDWRMPTLGELKTLLRPSENHQYIDITLFPNTMFLSSNNLLYYWTATSYENCNPTSGCAWVVCFRTSQTIGNHSKVNKHYIRAVRTLP